MKLHLEDLTYTVNEKDLSESVTPKTNKGRLNMNLLTEGVEEGYLKQLQKILEQYPIYVKKYQYNESKNSQVIRFCIDDKNEELNNYIKSYNQKQAESKSKFSDVASELNKSTKKEKGTKEEDSRSKLVLEFQEQSRDKLTEIEKVIVSNAINHLQDSNRKTVIVDLFSRHDKDGEYKEEHALKNTKYKAGDMKFTNKGDVEIHAAVLYHQDNKYLVVDPSNAEFSAILVGTRDDIRVCFNKKFQVYKPLDNENVGSAPDQWRDCIDIAVKLAFNLNSNKQAIELETIGKTEVIKTDSLKNNLSVEEVSNNTDVYKKLPNEIEAYYVRAKQSSDIVKQKLMTEGLKMFNFLSTKINQSITEIGFKYADAPLKESIKSYFDTKYTSEHYDSAYTDLKVLCSKINVNPIELLGLSEDYISSNFTD